MTPLDHPNATHYLFAGSYGPVPCYVMVKYLMWGGWIAEMVIHSSVRALTEEGWANGSAVEFASAQEAFDAAIIDSQLRLEEA